MCEIRVEAQIKSTPFIKVVGVASFCLDGGFRLIGVSLCKAWWFVFSLFINKNCCIHPSDAEAGGTPSISKKIGQCRAAVQP